jgi:hypothetical protein
MNAPHIFDSVAPIILDDVPKIIRRIHDVRRDNAKLRLSLFPRPIAAAQEVHIHPILRIDLWWYGLSVGRRAAAIKWILSSLHPYEQVVVPTKSAQRSIVLAMIALHDLEREKGYGESARQRQNVTSM